MTGELPVIGLALVLSGFVVLVGSALAVAAKSFKKSLLWGLACFLIPFATLVFTLRFWRDAKELFFAQLAGSILLLAGCGLMFSDPSIRSGLAKAMDHPSDLEAAIADQDPDGVPPAVRFSQILKSMGQPAQEGAEPPHKPAPRSSATPAARGQTPLDDARQRKAREMFASLQAWYLKLQQKRPGPGASPEEIRAFNQESAQYSALLEQYKKEAAAASSK